MNGEKENPSNRVVSQEGGSFNLEAENEALKKEIARLKSIESIHKQIKDDAEEQMYNIRPIPNPAEESISLDEQAEKIYTDVLEKMEEMKYVNGVSKKFCVREHGVDIDIGDNLEMKIALMEALRKIDDPACSKENIIKMIKNRIRRYG